MAKLRLIANGPHRGQRIKAPVGGPKVDWGVQILEHVHPHGHEGNVNTCVYLWRSDLRQWRFFNQYPADMKTVIENKEVKYLLTVLGHSQTSRLHRGKTIPVARKKVKKEKSAVSAGLDLLGGLVMRQLAKLNVRK